MGKPSTIAGAAILKRKRAKFTEKEMEYIHAPIVSGEELKLMAQYIASGCPKDNAIAMIYAHRRADVIKKLNDSECVKSKPRGFQPWRPAE